MIWMNKIYDLDQKRAEIFLIWIKKRNKYFWSGPKTSAFFLDLDQKLKIFFFIWINNFCFLFWSGSKNRDIFFDLDQKNDFFILIWIKKSVFSFWSKIKKYSNLDQRSLDKKMIHRFDPWSTNCEKRRRSCFSI